MCSIGGSYTGEFWTYPETLRIGYDQGVTLDRSVALPILKEIKKDKEKKNMKTALKILQLLKEKGLLKEEKVSFLESISLLIAMEDLIDEER